MLVAGVVSFDLDAVANTTIPKVWRASQPGVHATSPEIPTVQPSVLGRGDNVVYLRDFALADGSLPEEFDDLVRESFGDVVGAAASR